MYEKFQHSQSMYHKNDLRFCLPDVSRKSGEERQNQRRTASGHVTQQVRYLDKLVDELAKGKKMEKILRGS
jgi:hypothetical protein